MSRRRKSAPRILIVAVILGSLSLLMYHQDSIRDLVSSYVYPNLNFLIPQQNDTRKGASPQFHDAKATQTSAARLPIPRDAPRGGTGQGDTSATAGRWMPPPVPLPVVQPESSQAERRKAFGLQESVDYIVLKDEPFELHGRKVTIESLQQNTLGSDTVSGMPDEELARRIFPRIREGTIGASSDTPIPARWNPQPPASPQRPVYYGVRLVRPGENVWNIHYAIIREYFAYRHVILPVTADEPLANGRSSGVGRLLKFAESVVAIYDIDSNRPGRDPNRLAPQVLVVYFNISDLFSALDGIDPKDLEWLRFVGARLLLEGPDTRRDLLDRQALLE